MRRPLRRASVTAAFLAAALLPLAAPAPAAACSVAAGYLRPTNYELVRGADAIVLARATAFAGGPPAPGGPSASLGIFTFAVEAVLKGKVAEKTLRASGVDVSFGASPEDSFADPRPGAMRGMCTALDYRKGGLYVLFLHRPKEGWAVSGPPFTRINEEVKTAGSPWVVAVRHYSRIAALGDYAKEKAALERLLAEAEKSKDATAYPPALAADLRRHFATPTEAKSYEDLLRLYEKATAVDGRKEALWALARGKHGEARDLFRKLLAGDPGELLAPAVGWVETMHDADAVPDLVRLFLRRRDHSERFWIATALLAAADRRHEALMVKALKAADEPSADRLGRYFIRYPSAAAIPGLRRHLRGSYRDESGFAVTLAGAGDPRVLAWIKKELAVAVGEAREVPIRLLAACSLPAAEPLVRKIMDKGGRDLVYLIWGTYQEPHPRRIARLAEIAAKKDRSPEVTEALRSALRDLIETDEPGAAEILEKL